MLEWVRSTAAEGLKWLAGDPQEPTDLHSRVSQLFRRVEEFEAVVEAHKLRMANIAAECEESLTKASQRWAQLRAAESKATKRANGADETETQSGIPDLTKDPDGYRRWLTQRT